MMTHFNKFSDYLRFGWAQEFTEGQHKFHYTPNNCERFGNFIAQPVLKPLDFTLRNSRNPLFIMALTIIAICATTVLFYPSIIAGFFSAIVLISLKIGLYSLLVTTITGLCLRTLGRLNNRILMDKWDKGEIVPQDPGMIKL